MPHFLDTFHRGNGPIGGNWTVLSGSPQVVNNELWCTYPGTAYVNYVSGPQSHVVEAVMRQIDGYGYWQHLIIKFDPTSQLFYQLNVYPNGAYTAWQISRNNFSSYVMLAEGAIAHTTGATYKLKFSYNSGILQAWIDDFPTTTVADNVLDLNNYVGWWNGTNNSWIESFDVQIGAAATFAVTPSPIGNFGKATVLTFAGSGTDWTNGTPGVPLFTVDHGTLTAQGVTAPGQANAIYDPGTFLGNATFTDPSTGLTCVVLVTSDPTLVPGAGIGLSPTAIAYIERSAIAQANPTILNQEAPVGLGGLPKTAQSALGDFWRWLAATVDPEYQIQAGDNWAGLIGKVLNNNAIPPSGSNIFDYSSTAAYESTQTMLSLSEMRTVYALTLRQITGDDRIGEVPSIAGVYDMLGVAQQNTYNTLLDALLSVGTDVTNGTSDLHDLFGVLTTPNNYNLGTLLDAIGNIQPGGSTNLTPVLDAIAAMRGNGSATVSATQTQANAIKAVVDALATSLGQVRGSSNHTIQTILDAIDNSNGGDYSAVLNAISALRGNNTSTVKAIEDSLAEYRTGNDYTVADILDKIKATEAGTDWTLPALGLLLLLLLLGMPEIAMGVVAAGGALTIPAILEILANAFTVANGIRNIWDWLHQAKEWRPVPNAPAYPGYNDVDWGVPSDFVDAIRLPGIMDGAIIRISTPGRAPYAIKEALITRYSRLGTFAFQCDETSYEHIQPVQFLEQLATPKAMNTAIAILVQCKPGTVGTVTPYKLKTASPWPILGIARL